MVCRRSRACGPASSQKSETDNWRLRSVRIGRQGSMRAPVMGIRKSFRFFRQPADDVQQLLSPLRDGFGMLGKRLVVLHELIQQPSMAVDIFRMIAQRSGFLHESVGFLLKPLLRWQVVRSFVRSFVRREIREITAASATRYLLWATQSKGSPGPRASFLCSRSSRASSSWIRPAGSRDPFIRRLILILPPLNTWAALRPGGEWR
jgi:hypothetical protein